MKTLRTVVAIVLLAIPSIAMAQNSGNVEVTLTVTAPQAPTVAVLDLPTIPLGTLDVSQLTSPQSSGPTASFCVTVSNPDNQPVAPKLTFSQPGVVFRPEIGTRFALVGPNRSDGTQAQLPLDILYVGAPGLTDFVVRGQQSLVSPNYATACGPNPNSYANGTEKPYLAPIRQAAPDNLNPGGAYSATILVTVSAN